MKVTIEVNYCNQCPYYDFDDVCCSKDDGIDIYEDGKDEDGNDKIPDNCPLLKETKDK